MSVRVKRILFLLSFLLIAIGLVFLLYWAVDCLPLSIAGKLVVAGVVSLLFLISGIYLYIRDWRRKVIEDFVVSKKGKNKMVVLS